MVKKAIERKRIKVEDSSNMYGNSYNVILQLLQLSYFNQYLTLLSVLKGLHWGKATLTSHFISCKKENVSLFTWIPTILYSPCVLSLLRECATKL